MKKTIIIVSLVIALLAGCQSNQQLALREALGDAIIIGQEIEKVERAAGDIKTADQILVWTNAGQQILDTGSYGDNCALMLSVSDIAYGWLADKYPDKVEYRIVVALLRARLENYCGGMEP